MVCSPVVRKSGQTAQVRMPLSKIPSFWSVGAVASFLKACLQLLVPIGALAVLAAGCVVPRTLSPGKAYWQKHYRPGVQGQMSGTLNKDAAQTALVMTETAIRDHCT